MGFSLQAILDGTKSYMPQADPRQLGQQLVSKLPDPRNAKDLTMDDIRKQATWDNAYKAYNGAIAALVFYRYCTTPDAAFFEYFLDIGIHGFEALCSDQQHTLGFMLNAGRFGIAFNGFFTGMSTIPMRANLFDMAFHGANSYKRFQDVEQEIISSVTPPPVLSSGGPGASAPASSAAAATAGASEPDDAKPPKKTQ